MFRVCKSITFEAAHNLPNYDGPPRNVHGHSYRVEVFVVGTELAELGAGSTEGMLVDFATLDAALRDLRDGLNHTYLNNSALSMLGVRVSTNEQLALGIYEWLKRRLEYLLGACRLEKVRVYDTATSWSEFAEDSDA